jgi:hypothetical protein
MYVYVCMYVCMYVYVENILSGVPLIMITQTDISVLICMIIIFRRCTALFLSRLEEVSKATVSLWFP